MMVEDFKKHNIVPDVIDQAPAGQLHINFESKNRVQPGTELSIDQVKQQPKLEWDAESNAMYTVTMIDPDATCKLLWLVTNVPRNDINKGQTLAEYLPSEHEKGQKGGQQGQGQQIGQGQGQQGLSSQQGQGQGQGQQGLSSQQGQGQGQQGWSSQQGLSSQQGQGQQGLSSQQGTQSESRKGVESQKGTESQKGGREKEHRIVCLVYKQPESLNITEQLGNRNNRNNFKLQDFTNKHKLGKPIAGNFFVCKCDTNQSIVNK